MNTNDTKQDRLMIIIVLAGLVLAAVAFLLPAKAEAGLRVSAILGDFETSVAVDSPQGRVVQTGPRSYRLEPRVRPPRPLRGRYVWVPGHFEQVITVRDCRKVHGDNGLHPGHKGGKRNRQDHVDRGRRQGRAPRHDHYREVWVPGHWQRI